MRRNTGFVTLAAALLGTAVVKAQTPALDILLVGDFGWTPDMSDPNKNFDAINAYVGNLTQK